MRICLTSINYEPEKSGIGPYTTALATGLAARGHDVQVLTSLPHYPEWSVYPAFADASGTVRSQDGVVVRRFGHYVPRDPTARRRLLFEISFGLRIVGTSWGKPDIVLTTTPALVASTFVALRAKAAHVPIGVIVQDLYGKGVVETGALSGRAASLTARLESKLLRSATGIAVVHDRFSAAAQDMGVDPSRITVIRNWSRSPGQQSAVSTVDVRKKYGWRSNERIILHTGNMGAKQGLENVVEAARLADRSSDDIRFILLGDGNQRHALQRLGAGVERLEFIDPVEEHEYQQLLAAADVLLVNERPGVGEMAVPSKLTSYFAAGRPVLAATLSNGVTAQEIRDSRAGVIIGAGDPGALLQMSLKLADDPAQAAEMGLQGRKYAQRLLSAEHALDLYDDWCYRLSAAARK